MAGGIGQIGASAIALDSAEIFNPASGTWSNADTLATARYSQTATLMSDGRSWWREGAAPMAPP